MARKRLPEPPPATPIDTLGQADAALAELASLQRLEEQIKNDLNAAIDALKAEARDAAAPLQARMDELTRGLGRFAETHRAELFGAKKSVELPHGEFGYRKSTVLKPQPKFTWAKVLAKLKELGFIDGIRTKYDVDKEALRQWSDEKLALVGARRVSRDGFWVEVKAEPLPPAA